MTVAWFGNGWETGVTQAARVETGTYQQQPLGESAVQSLTLGIVSGPRAGNIMFGNSGISIPCVWPDFSGQTLLQDQSRINLNQPASCFLLVRGQSLAQSIARVTEATAASEIIVNGPVNAPALSRDSVLPSPASSTSFPQSLPLAAAGALAVLFAGSVRRRLLKISQTLQLHPLLSLSELGVMRC